MKVVRALMWLSFLALWMVNCCYAQELSTDAEGGQIYAQACDFDTAGKTTEAIQCYQKAINTSPKGEFSADAKLHLSRLNAISYIKSKEFAKAEAEIKANANAFEKNAEYEWYVFSVAGEYETAGQSNNAKEYYAKTLEKFPKGKCSANAKLSLSRLNVLSYIKSGQFDKAEAEVKTNAAEFERNAGHEWYLYSIGLCYDENKRPEDARNYFNKVAEKYPDSKCGSVAKLHLRAMDVLSLIKKGDDNRADDAIVKIKADFAGNPELCNYILYIAEGYYDKGLEISKGTIGSENIYFDKSISLAEEQLDSGKLNNSMLAEYNYMVGMNLQNEGQFSDAAKAFEKSYNANPKFIYADYCLFENIRCFVRLAEAKINKWDSAKIDSLYQTLLKEYPQSKYCSQAEFFVKQTKAAEK